MSFLSAIGINAPFPWTLQRYIFREMGKTFLLAAIALTGVLGLGGGVMEMIELGEVTPGQLVRLLGLVLPVAAALTLPIAALFSAAATYGRLSADNEFVACRSSGINLHILFLPSLALSLASAVVTFCFINFLIPGMVRSLNEFVSADLGALIQQRLNRPRGITLGGRYRIYADDSVIDRNEPDRVLLRGIAFVEVDGEEWVRYGTAKEFDARFERTESRTRVSAVLRGLSFYDRRQGRFVDLAEQVLPSNDLPHLVPQEIKFLNLSELLHYWRHPGTWREVQDAMERLRIGVAKAQAIDALLANRDQDGTITLADDNTHYTIRSKSALRIPRGGGIELTDVSITTTRGGRPITYKAERAVIDTTRGDTLRDCALRLQAYGVESRNDDAVVHQTKVSLTPVAMPASLIARVEGYSDEQLLAPQPEEQAEGDGTGGELADAREVRSSTVRKIIATVHERMAFSVSVLALVLLGAALGIVFRGSHTIVAFGVSFVPSLVVIVAIVMGKQMAQNESTHLVGLSVMWLGIAFVVALDFWTLTRVLRR